MVNLSVSQMAALRAIVASKREKKRGEWAKEIATQRDCDPSNTYQTIRELVAAGLVYAVQTKGAEYIRVTPEGRALASAKAVEAAANEAKREESEILSGSGQLNTLARCLCAKSGIDARLETVRAAIVEAFQQIPKKRANRLALIADLIAGLEWCSLPAQGVERALNEGARRAGLRI